MEGIVCSFSEQLIFPRPVTLLHFFPVFLPLFVLPFFSLPMLEVRLFVVLLNLQASSQWRRLGAVMLHFTRLHRHLPPIF